jgi:heme/copper-type cytochrome/quinol oxidase subunit 2
MTTRARLALLAAVVVIAVVAFVVLKPSDSKKSTSSATPVAVLVQHGKPVGGIKTITVNKGGQVRFVVTSDVSDEIHVHGYNFHKEVKAGGKVSFSFPAKMDGVFVVELEGRGEQIASLVVNP